MCEDFKATLNSSDRAIFDKINLIIDTLAEHNDMLLRMACFKNGPDDRGKAHQIILELLHEAKIASDIADIADKIKTDCFDAMADYLEALSNPSLTEDGLISLAKGIIFSMDLTGSSPLGERRNWQKNLRLNFTDKKIFDGINAILDYFLAYPDRFSTCNENTMLTLLSARSPGEA